MLRTWHGWVYRFPRPATMQNQNRTKDMTTIQKTILNDPASSYWLKTALEKALGRAPCDALRDAATLQSALRAPTGSGVCGFVVEDGRLAGGSTWLADEEREEREGPKDQGRPRPSLHPDEEPDINEYSWESLNAYHYDADDTMSLIVITTADLAQFREAVRREGILREHECGGSIERVLRDLGHAAVTGQLVDDDGRSV